MQHVVHHQDFNCEKICLKNKDLKLQKKKTVFRHGIMCILSPRHKTISY